MDPVAKMRWDRVHTDDKIRRYGTDPVDPDRPARAGTRTPHRKKAPRPPLEARYPGTCQVCREPIEPGDPIRSWNKEKKTWVHADCPNSLI